MVSPVVDYTNKIKHFISWMTNECQYGYGFYIQRRGLLSLHTSCSKNMKKKSIINSNLQLL